MADFFQNGVITTLHDLADRPVAEFEAELTGWAAQRPMALIIPSLFSELDGEALPTIVDALGEVEYLDEVIIGLDRADASQFEVAQRFFDRLPMRQRILWHDGPRLRAIDAELADHGLAPVLPGKGRNVWYCMGYALAAGRASVVALHDADIATYSRALPARLLYPLANPGFGYAFAKGYYHRTDGRRLNGRVARLLVTPLVRALVQVVGPHDYLQYLDSFRYPLAGEFAMEIELAREMRIPSDWGLEIGVLSEVYRNYTARRVCQVDLGGAYDHKHREVSADDPATGLHRMAIDISKALFRRLAVGGQVFSPAVFRTLEATYHRLALDMVDRYQHDAEMNGYELDRRAEADLVAVFSRAVATAGVDYLSQPMEIPTMAPWSAVLEAMPHVGRSVVEAVEADNAGDPGAAAG